MSKNVFVFGIFDLVHQGHYRLFNFSRSLGDTLTVGILNNPNESHSRVTKDERIKYILETGLVDHVLVVKNKLNDFIEEKSGVVPNTKWKKKFIGQNWYLGETLHSGIGQGYFQSTPMQLCLMTAQIANGGFEIKPRILVNDKKNNLREYIKYKNENPNEPLPIDMLVFYV